MTKQKILIIDDNCDLAEFRKEFIQKALPNSKIFIVDNPKEALLHKDIDIIFCDISSLTDVKHPRIETLDYSVLLKFRKSVLILYSGVNSWASSIVDEIKREHPKQIVYFMPNDTDLMESFILKRFGIASKCKNCGVGIKLINNTWKHSKYRRLSSWEIQNQCDKPEPTVVE